MDLEQLQTYARSAYDRELARKNIQHQMQSRLTVSYGSGVFLVSQELILFTDYLQRMQIFETVMLDHYQTPIMVNTVELNRIALARYQEVMNEWQLEWQKQSAIRSVKNV